MHIKCKTNNSVPNTYIFTWNRCMYVYWKSGEHPSMNDKKISVKLNCIRENYYSNKNWKTILYFIISFVRAFYFFTRAECYRYFHQNGILSALRTRRQQCYQFVLSFTRTFFCLSVKSIDKGICFSWNIRSIHWYCCLLLNAIY